MASSRSETSLSEAAILYLKTLDPVISGPILCSQDSRAPPKIVAVKTCFRTLFDVSCPLQNIVLRSSVTQTYAAAFRSGSTPGKPDHQSGQGNGVNRPLCAVPVEPDAMRVACPCSTEARGSNPAGFVAQTSNLHVRSDGIILMKALGARAMQTNFDRRGYSPSSKLSCSKRVSSRKAANPPTGFGPTGFVQRVPLWGAFDW